jgi:ribonuclease-3
LTRGNAALHSSFIDKAYENRQKIFSEREKMGTTIQALIQDHEEELEELQKKIEYSFQNIELLQVSLVHSSFAFERLDCGRHNETQEFLGDAVLDLTVGHLLFTRFPEMREGKLTRIRSALVNETGLSEMARSLNLGKYLLLGRGEDASAGREKSSILSCAFEAMVGAMFLDGGYPVVEKFVRRTFEPLIAERGHKLTTTDAKSGLQEWLQEKYNEGPAYVLDAEEGPAHARIFSVSVHFQEKVLGEGRASSKKEAEQRAARAALDFLTTTQEQTL